MADLDELERLRSVYDRATKCTSRIGAARLSLILDARAMYETALFAAAEELVRDARRLAYLASFFSPMGLDANGNHPWMCRNNPARLRGPNLRAAIDAAIAQEQP